MSTHVKDIEIVQGSRFLLSFQWLADSETTPGTPGDPIDLTDASIEMQVRRKQGAPVVISASTTEGTITHNGTGGQITVDLPDTLTDLCTVRTGRYDIEVLLGDGERYRVLEGKVTTSPNITQKPGDPVVN